MQIVAAGIAHTGVKLLDAGFCLLPVVTELLVAAHGLLRVAQGGLMPFDAVERLQNRAVAQGLVNSLKGVSSHLLRKERPDIEKRYWKGGCGRTVTLLQSVAGRRLQSCDSTSSSRRRIKPNDRDGYVVRAILPRP